MRVKLLALVLALMVLAPLSVSYAYENVCPQPPQATDTWTVAWTDTYNETTYTLQAPCKVYLGIEFNITATVTDSFTGSAEQDVAFGWAIKDNGTTILGGGWNYLRLDTNRQWTRVIPTTYAGEPIDHTIEFLFTDLGRFGGGAHFWRNNLMGHLTVDPYPPSANNAPVADAGADVALMSSDQAQTILFASATDADSDPLTYRWLEGSIELVPLTPVNANGDVSLDLGAIPPLALGAHTLVLEVSDGKDTVSDSVIVALENSAPTVAVSGGGTYQLWSDVSAQASVSDYDGDELYYEWYDGANLLATGTVLAPYGGAPITLPTYVFGGFSLGSHTLTLKLTDGLHDVFAEVYVEVVDTVAPSLAPSASASVLWPPMGQMVDVLVAANARDNSGSLVSLSVLVTGNVTTEDYEIASIDQQAGVVYLRLRAKKASSAAELVYRVVVTATDESANSSSAEVQIKVPHDMRRK